MTGLKPKWLELINLLDIKGFGDPSYFVYKLREIYQILEDVYSVGSMTELQDAIDGIGTGAGTIFIEAGTHVVDTPIDIDGGGSLVIYGHGDNTILQPDDGINVFNITDCASLTIKTLQIDATNYTGATSSVIVDEVNDNVITIEDVSIVGNNLGTGIELISNNCIVEHCNIDNMLDGIYLNNSNRHIIAQNTVSNNARYGIYLDTVLYSNVSNNICNLNLTGIFVDSSTNNSISNNISNQNTENGIYLTTSSYNTVSGNTCENNDSNTANDQAGIFITANSDFNTITGNSINNNNNIGAGTGYGIIIALNTCNENVIASNNANGNDIDYQDSGTATTIIYYVQNNDEIQDAIDSIGNGTGTIVMTAGNISITTTLNVDGGGSYIIEGQGDNTVLTPSGNWDVFNITSAISCIFRDFEINAANINGEPIFTVNEAADNPIFFERIHTIGDANRISYVFNVASNNVYIKDCITYQMGGLITAISVTHITIENCSITDCGIGGNFESIDFDAVSYSKIISNIIDTQNNYGIRLENVSTYNIIRGNVIIDTSSAGIRIRSSTNNIIEGNTISSSGTEGIQLSDSVYNNVNNNMVDSAGSSGISVLSASHHTTLIGNSCYGSSINGIYISQSSNISIVGNVCNNAVNNDGILIFNGSNYITVGNNVCNNNDQMGINLFTGISYCTVVGNTCCSNLECGIQLYSGNTYNIIANNVCSNNDSVVDEVTAGIILITGCDYNNISENICNNNNSAGGASSGYGIRIQAVNCDANQIIGNQLVGNDTNYQDLGTGTVLYADDTVYGAGWNGDLGTPTKNAVYDIIKSITDRLDAHGI